MRQARKTGQGFQNPTDPDLLREYASKGAAGNKAAARGAGTWIEGEYLTTAQIGERLGVSGKHAASLLSKARRMAGPVTWDRLRGGKAA
jgi:hypothetical protein